MTNLRFNYNGPNAVTIELDGKEISRSVQEIEIHAGVNELPEVRLSLVAPVVETTTTPAFVVLDNATRELLIRFGWTPPPSERTPVPPASEVNPLRLIQAMLAVGCEKIGGRTGAYVRMDHGAFAHTVTVPLDRGASDYGEVMSATLGVVARRLPAEWELTIYPGLWIDAHTDETAAPTATPGEDGQHAD